MCRILALISSKGGTGKSTVAVALASALSAAGRSVLLADCDEGARCLDTMLGVNSDTVFDIGDVLSDERELSDVVIKTGIEGRINLLPSPLSPEPLDLKKLSLLFSDVNQSYDYIIADMRGQLTADRVSALPDTTQFILVTSTDPVTVRNTGILSSELAALGKKPLLIINKFTGYAVDGTYVNLDSVVDSACSRLLGIVPYDRKISANSGPSYYGPAAAAVYRIASRIEGNSVPLPDIETISE